PRPIQRSPAGPTPPACPDEVCRFQSGPACAAWRRIHWKPRCPPRRPIRSRANVSRSFRRHLNLNSCFAIIGDVAHTELEAYQRQGREIREQASELTAGLTEAQFNWKPSPNQWSIEECMAHLVMVGQVEVREIEAAVQEGLARGIKGTSTFEFSLIDRFL